MENIKIVSIDLAKHVFQVRGATHRGREVFNKRVYRDEVLREVLKAKPGSIVAMEACGSSHYWGRLFEKSGYKVKLVPPQYAKAYLKSQKNDAADAEAIGEAASRDSMRLVALKTEEQQEIQSLHRIRSRLVRSRTALSNEIRGIAGEYGYVIPRGYSGLRKWLNKEHQEMSERLKRMFRKLYEELVQIEEKFSYYDKELKVFSNENEVCKRAQTVPGVGPIISTAVYAAIGRGNQFKNGRGFAAWLGLVPQQHSTGGKAILGRISKKGDRYLRSLFVQGAVSVMRHSRPDSKLDLWIKNLRERKCHGKTSVAVANRLARTLWAVMNKDGAVYI